jgi:S1-C subfamily serine protease
MRSVLGDEIKLTDGIVSSKTGFKGDVTAYQITVPLQPGNSGGPLFSSSGAVVGIVNAKFQDGENVSYAIKANYLRNLFDLLSEAPVFPVAKSMAGLSLTEQSKILRDFVYTIEVY